MLKESNIFSGSSNEVGAGNQPSKNNISLEVYNSKLVLKPVLPEKVAEDYRNGLEIPFEYFKELNKLELSEMDDKIKKEIVSYFENIGLEVVKERYGHFLGNGFMIGLILSNNSSISYKYINEDDSNVMFFDFHTEDPSISKEVCENHLRNIMRNISAKVGNVFKALEYFYSNN